MAPLEIRHRSVRPISAKHAQASRFLQQSLPWRDLFAEIEPVLRGANGRPHWAKRHTLRAEDVHALYPRTGDFLKVRAEVDPAGKFVNADLARLFGI
jgi:FAD/FMN-containing dehydrogenase